MPRFNYTNRSRIYRSDADIELEDHGRFVDPKVNLDLGRYGFPGDSPIWIEFYTSSFLRRISFGTVDHQGFKGPRAIQGGPDASELKVRLKVLDSNPDTSLILGMMKGCKPGYKDESGDERNEALLDLKSARLDGEVWKLEIQQERDEHPVLFIDERFGDYQGLARSPWFQAAIMPSVFREVLTSIIILNNFSDADDNSIWGLWLIFARQFSQGAKDIPVVDPKSEEWSTDVQDASTWIDSAVSNWARSNHYRDEFGAYLKGN